MTLTAAVNGLRVNTHAECTGPRLVPWRESLSPGATCRIRAARPAVFLSVTLPQTGPTGGRLSYLWKVRVALIFIIVEVGCYCRTSLCLCCMSPVPLWKNTFSKAPFRCSPASLPWGGSLRRPGEPLLIASPPFCRELRKGFCYEIRVPWPVPSFHLCRLSKAQC